MASASTPPVPSAFASDVQPDVTAFFDTVSSTISYVVKDPDSAACAVIDSVLDLDEEGSEGPESPKAHAE